MPFHVSLAERALSEFVNSLFTKSTQLNSSAMKAIEALLHRLEDGLCGRLKNKIILASIDPGLGKSHMTSLLLKHFHMSGYASGGSVLICVSTKQEILSYVNAIGLSQSDFAVVTADRELNALGCDKKQHGSARIMFTTQQLVKLRSQNALMKDLPEFHYQGRKRALYIWDESLELEEWSSISVQDLAKLRGDWPRTDMAGERIIRAFEATILDEQQSRMLIAPAALKCLTVKPLRKHLRPLARRLRNLAGEQVSLVVSSDGHRSIVYQSATLPTDLLPLVVLDASGRVRNSYDEMKNNGRPIEVIEAIRNYWPLTVHVMKRGSGKVTLGSSGPRTLIAKEVAHLISMSGGEWLVVHDKDFPTFKSEIEGLVNDGTQYQLHTRTWGLHKSTNEFSHVPNVVLVGQPTYPDEAYIAQHYAACGHLVPETELPSLDHLKTKEKQHHYLQAGTRGSIRRGQPCNLYVITTPCSCVEEWLADTFPMATINAWHPADPQLSGKVRQAIDWLVERFKDPTIVCVPKKELRLHLDMKASNFSKDVLKHPSFVASLEKLDLRLTRNEVERSKYSSRAT